MLLADPDVLTGRATEQAAIIGGMETWRVSLRRNSWAVVGFALLGGCAATAPTPSVAEAIAGTVSDRCVTLEATAEKAAVHAGEPILVEASLTNDTPEPIILAGSGDGLVVFTVTRQEDGLTSGPPLLHLSCATYSFASGERMDIPFEKRDR
jgi:hypothetical protein